MESATAINSTPHQIWAVEMSESTATAIADALLTEESHQPLHEWVVYDPASAGSDAKWKHVALIIALYSAFILYAVATIAAFSYIVPSSFLLAILALAGSFVFLEKVFIPYVTNPLITSMGPYGEAHGEGDAILSRMKKIEDTSVLPKLQALGIDPSTSESAQIRANPLLLKPLLARYEYAERELQSELTWVDIRKSSMFERPLENDAVRQFEIGTWKLHQALALHVLQHPTSTKTLESLISRDWKWLQYATHAKSWTEEEYPLAKERPIWTAPSGQTYNYKQLLDTPVPELIQTFFQNR